MRTTFGDVEFRLSAVTVMQCFVGAANWSARGSDAEIAEFKQFGAAFFPHLLAQPHDGDLDDVCDAAIAEVDAVIARLDLRSDLLWRFGWRLKNTLVSHRNRDEARRLALGYRDWLEGWAGGPAGELARRALAQAAAWGVAPMLPCLGAARAFGDAVYGQYSPRLRAICLQLDVICGHMDAEVQFIETLLHEQMHAAIHHHMGDEQGRRKLTWLDELAAVLTSQSALRNAARELGDAERRRVVAILGRLRQEQEYGDLADAVLRAARHPLVPWHAWQAIFALPPEERHDYAVTEVIRPILCQAGWDVRFPFAYGDRYVTTFAHRSE